MLILILRLIVNDCYQIVLAPKGIECMSPEQLKMLQELSQMFEQGRAGPQEIKDLSDLLALINRQEEVVDPLYNNQIADLETRMSARG